MSIDRLLNSFQKRVPWSYFKSKLIEKRLPHSNGYSQTNNKLLRILNPEITEQIESLQEYYNEHLLTGDKIVQVYNLDHESRVAIEQEIENISIEDSEFATNFPFVLDVDEMETIPFDRPYFVHKSESENGIYLIFCTKKSFVLKVPLSASDLNPEVARNFDKVYGIKHEIFQFIDVIFIDRGRNLLELRLDYGHQKSLSTTEQKNGLSALRRKFERILPVSGNVFERNNPRNLFPLVGLLYRSNEGKVVELGFLTDESSIKNERMRTDRNIDLRQETYHRAGMGAVQRITPYKVSIAWPKPENSEENMILTLPGTYKTVSAVHPYIEQALISKCYTQEEYDFVFGKIIEYLGD